MDTSDDKENEYCETVPGKWVKIVRAMIHEVEFGEVQLSIHRGRVTEVRKLEKVRLDPGPSTAEHEPSKTPCRKIPH
ncbi:MAG: YezD family protein [Puniceicoccales bacterium]|nr:YezD family protein [Puniceicoccales bacterium]